MKKIYGFIKDSNINGVSAFAIDGDSKEVIQSHFCSSVGFAKSDLGFSKPYMQTVFSSNSQHSTVSFNKERHEVYDRLYPEGYELIWVDDPYSLGLL